MPAAGSSTTSASWLDAITASPAVDGVAALIGGGGTRSVRGAVGSSTVLLAAVLARRRATGAGPILLVVPHLDDADEAQDELEAAGIAVAKLPAMEVLPGETGVNLDLLAERLTLVRRVADGDVPPIIVAPIQALMQSVTAVAGLGRLLRVIESGATLDVNELGHWLDDAGYRRVETIETAGEFAVRGGIVDVFPAGGEPARIDLFGDEVEAINAIDLDTMGSDRRLDRLELVGGTAEALQADSDSVPFTDYLPDGSVAILAEVLEINEQGRSYYDRVHDARAILGPPAVLKELLRRCSAVVEVNQYTAGIDGSPVEMPVEPLPSFSETASEAVKELAEIAATARTVALCQNDGEADRLRELLGEFAPDADVEVEIQYLHRGLVWRGVGGPAGTGGDLALVPTHELLHRYQTRRRVRKLGGGRAMEAFIDLAAGDIVVHRDHGIARFLGLRTLTTAGGDRAEFLTLEFAKKAKLNVPATRIDQVQKYIGAFSGSPDLSLLGGKKWTRQKERVSEAVRDLAAEMLRLQAARESMPGIRYPDDTVWQHEFEAEFPYEETEDQLAAISAVKRDMTGPRPMDRLVCGDVGFGKTEVAIRAAFKAVEYGKQVAVLVPTTVLADQHERTFRQRFAAYPFRIETVSRFKTGREQKQVLEDLAAGRVDIIVGTHRVLSKDVRFADLGLVIIDEEQRFGVEHKQRLLGFRATADVLTLSATPIPRTLHMAMLGLRDISSLSTPPLDRRAIVTEVVPPNKHRIRQALERELAREGQAFYVHNRVHDIESVADDVARLVPDARIIVGHGQMPAGVLERVMRTFIRGEADILVCTTIIESGIDIPTANTMIVDSAHMFGLSELHQLRGRVGRYKHRAYCYLLLPRDQTISETAMRRLQALESFSMLGAGFRIALRDLEIRGAGNLLGSEQSGHIAAVGYEMYCHLLETAVHGLKRDGPDVPAPCVVDIGIEGSLPAGYIPSDSRRMDAYRRVAEAPDAPALEKVRRDLASAYGEPPRRAEILLTVAEIALAAAAIGVRVMKRHDDDIIFTTTRPDLLAERMDGVKGSLRLVGNADGRGQTTVYFRPPKRYLESDSLLTVLRRRLGGASSASRSAPAAATR